jgi:lincosamide nucleotidyltransferase A/C/D/E
MKKAEISAQDVVGIINLLEQNDIEVYVDGGWGVDALLGEQTRKHDDLDIALPHEFVPKLRKILEARGYIDVPRDDTRECNFVLGDGEGRLIDVHSYTFDEKGKNIFGVAYEPHHLTGTGTINGYPVKCIPPDVMVEFHTGYDVDENDYHDIKVLCERFNIPLPTIYEEFERKFDL